MKNKVIWITGASSGIGEALVYACNQKGARIIISARNQPQLQQVKAQCMFPENICILPLDLEDHEALITKAAEALQYYNGIDMLINSGGISQRALAIDTNLTTAQRLMNVNFWGSVILAKAVLPHMLTKNNGHLVCISSLVGKFGTPLRSAYAASKHALHGFFDSLRAELPESIKITMICPGFIKTRVTINALTADGSAQGTMDNAQENGMAAGECALKIIKAIEKQKYEVYIGGKEIIGVWIKRFFPRRFAGIIRKAKVV